MLQSSMLVREVRGEREKATEGDAKSVEEAPGPEKRMEERGLLERTETLRRSPQRIAREC